MHRSPEAPWGWSAVCPRPHTEDHGASYVVPLSAVMPKTFHRLLRSIEKMRWSSKGRGLKPAASKGTLTCVNTHGEDEQGLLTRPYFI